MNSLYGRFGLNPSVKKKYFFKSREESSNLIEKHSPVNLDEYLELGDLSLCSFTSPGNSGTNTNVAIASFVTAYARIMMS